MNEIAKLIDAVIATELAPRLKIEHYRKFGRTFTRVSGAATQIVNIQASQRNYDREGKFTLNFGVYFPAVAQIRGLVAKGAYPKEYDATIRTRIGSLMPDGLDHWWHASSPEDIPGLAHQVSEAYTHLGRPWLTNMLSLEQVAEQQLDPLTAASVALCLGRREVATNILKEALRTAHTQFAPTLRRFAERYDLQSVESNDH